MTASINIRLLAQLGYVFGMQATMTSSDSPLAVFKRLAESFSELIEDEGIFIRPYANPNLIHFSRLTPDEQWDVIARVKLYVLACVNVKEHHRTLTDNRLMVETFLHVSGMTAHPQDLNLIEDKHFIEIYNKNGMHLFRSLNIFESSSYTFEDLCCRQWYHLYERPTEDQNKIIQAATEFFMQTEPVRKPADAGPMRIVEKDTLEHLIYLTETKWLIPVFKNQSLDAVLTVVINWNPDSIPQFVKP
ncbi:hypothetical protein [Bdellovibrio sp. KM01]|uniref:hypothetical protein n=1 Tax=Bdellovibrio sp. KM01 TaxID=2748865 RepID=UPI0015EA0C6A|nr:hypothetical protein [Bdellovibrio sp. KM01]QLY26296.1 hypothetical protein HW988_04500 [Bdellovibrio sp. KM01]